MLLCYQLPIRKTVHFVYIEQSMRSHCVTYHKFALCEAALIKTSDVNHSRLYHTPWVPCGDHKMRFNKQVRGLSRTMVARETSIRVACY